MDTATLRGFFDCGAKSEHARGGHPRGAPGLLKMPEMGVGVGVGATASSSFSAYFLRSDGDDDSEHSSAASSDQFDAHLDENEEEYSEDGRFDDIPFKLLSMGGGSESGSSSPEVEHAQDEPVDQLKKMENFFASGLKKQTEVLAAVSSKQGDKQLGAGDYDSEATITTDRDHVEINKNNKEDDKDYEYVEGSSSSSTSPSDDSSDSEYVPSRSELTLVSRKQAKVSPGQKLNTSDASQSSANLPADLSLLSSFHSSRVRHDSTSSWNSSSSSSEDSSSQSLGFPYSVSYTRQYRRKKYEKRFPCENCGKYFSFPSVLRRHMERSVVCKHVFKDKLGVAGKAANGGVRPIEGLTEPTAFPPVESTDYQGYQPARPPVLRDGVKVHECTFCPAFFKGRDNLKKHELRHTGARPYECTLCGKSFRQSSNLTRHKLVHSEKRAHACPVESCKRPFKTRDSLKMHLAMLHGVPPPPSVRRAKKQPKTEEEEEEEEEAV